MLGAAIELITEAFMSSKDNCRCRFVGITCWVGDTVVVSVSLQDGKYESEGDERVREVEIERERERERRKNK